MAGMIRRTVFHVDMDAFYASVEQRDHPEYRKRPVIVGAKVGTRGVVSAASYEARVFGIHSAMPISEAFTRCPHGVFVTPRMKVYRAVSEMIMDIFSEFSPVVEQISVDEAFLDMTGTERLFESPLKAAQLLTEKIRKQQQLTASIGIAPNKFCAKIASDLNKPAGCTVCPESSEEIIAWLAPMSVDKIWGIGKKTAAQLNSSGIRFVGDLQKLTREKMIRRFGKHGSALHDLVRGIDRRPVGAGPAAKSISREHTFAFDTSDRDVWRSTLFTLTQDVSRQARRSGVKGSTVFITYRKRDFSRHTRRKTVVHPTNVARFIFEEALSMVGTVETQPLRLIGVGITNLELPLQTSLFDDESVMATWEQSEKAIDAITDRFGGKVIRKGCEICKPVLKKKDK